MRRVYFFSLFAISCFFLALGCATGGSQHTDADQRLLDSYPADVRRTIESGDVAIGFDQDQVRMAWGLPDRERTRETSAGREIVWEYTSPRPPRLGVSVGGGTRGVGGGVGVSTSGQREVRKRVVFDRTNGQVSEYERRD